MELIKLGGSWKFTVSNNAAKKYSCQRRPYCLAATSLHTALRPKLVTLETGDELELNCKAVADIRLEIRYIWFRDDVIINFTADQVIKRFVARIRSPHYAVI